ncbi:AEC family transporter [Alkalihalobacillus sp. BA299]|uniref:AEC family transporter n=1 Tax=Alkalihalobacillus sp. BA299 TaxID=2815938 RepID=UPI001ADB5CE8|nr:AEC family transporter [Alkalihalobacillus sp. BA299]
MEFSSIIVSISVMAIIIIIGIIIEKKVTLNIEAKQLILFIIVNIALPCIILNGVFNTEITEDVLSRMLMIFLFSMIINCLGMGLGLVISKMFQFDSVKSRKIAILSGMGNTGFIGIPLCANIFGPMGGLLASIFDAGVSFTAFTIGILLLQENRKFSFQNLKALINPPVIAIVSGLAFAIIGFEAPVIVKQLTANLANLAAPLAMLYVGMVIPSIFSEGKKAISFQFMSVPITIKLFILPIMTIILIKGMPIHNLLKEITIIQSAMPTFMLASVLFARYTNGDNRGIVTIIYSTIISLVTIPIITLFAKLWLDDISIVKMVHEVIGLL